MCVHLSNLQYVCKKNLKYLIKYKGSSLETVGDRWKKRVLYILYIVYVDENEHRQLAVYNNMPPSDS